MKQLAEDAIELLKNMIKTPSYSGEEKEVLEVVADWFKKNNIDYNQDAGYNLWAKNKYYDPNKPTILLNSHLDTVKPNGAYTRDPFSPDIEDGKLYGLGSNDAGGPLVSLLATFKHFYLQENLNYNLIIAPTAEEEANISPEGKGLERLQDHLPKIDVGIVGEPTSMDMAIAERGLIVLDVSIKGKTGHAAHIPNSENSIYKTGKVLNWFDNSPFDKESELLGPIKMTPSIVSAGTQHNVVPPETNMTVDIRINEHYTNEEVVETISKGLEGLATVNTSIAFKSSCISKEHPLVKAGKAQGFKLYGSPTLSDQAVLKAPSIKMGPGDTNRSHSADEFIYLKEIEEAIPKYIKLLSEIIY